MIHPGVSLFLPSLLLFEVTHSLLLLKPLWLGFQLFAAENFYLIVIIVSSATGAFPVFSFFPPFYMS